MSATSGDHLARQEREENGGWGGNTASSRAELDSRTQILPARFYQPDELGEHIFQARVPVYGSLRG